MSALWSLVLLCKLLSLAIGQSVNESRCTYTFTVPLEYFESQCMTHELRSNLEEIRRENKQITSENAKLKEKIENLSKVISMFKNIHKIVLLLFMCMVYILNTNHSTEIQSAYPLF